MGHRTSHLLSSFSFAFLFLSATARLPLPYFLGLLLFPEAFLENTEDEACHQNQDHHNNGSDCPHGNCDRKRSQRGFYPGNSLSAEQKYAYWGRKMFTEVTWYGKITAINSEITTNTLPVEGSAHIRSFTEDLNMLKRQRKTASSFKHSLYFCSLIQLHWYRWISAAFSKLMQKA